MENEKGNLIGVEAPELELFFEERTADGGRIVKFACAVVIEDLGKDSRMPVEKVFVENWVVVGQGFCQPRQSRGRDLLERRPVRLETETAHVENDAVLAVHLLFLFAAAVLSSALIPSPAERVCKQTIVIR